MTATPGLGEDGFGVFHTRASLDATETVAIERRCRVLVSRRSGSERVRVAMRVSKGQ